MVTPTSPRRYGPVRIGVVLSGWPRVSETFALNELLALEQAGMLAFVAATKPGDSTLVQPGVERLTTSVHVLADGDVETQAIELASLVDGRVDALHGYFAHTPALVARRAAALVGARFGFSSHALDVRKVEPLELKQLAADAECVVACNHDTLEQLRRVGASVEHLPHGVDTSQFVATPLPSADCGLELLAVGRLVEKKGFPFLVEAIARTTSPTRLRIVGDGPMRAELETQIDALGLADRIELVGRLTHTELPAVLAACHAVVVPSIVDSRGDRDGLPNVVLEAMASGRPVIGSAVAAVATAVRDGSTGLLVPAGDVSALSDAIDTLSRDAALCARLGADARRLVETEFELANCTERFVRTLEAAYG